MKRTEPEHTDFFTDMSGELLHVIDGLLYLAEGKDAPVLSGQDLALILGVVRVKAKKLDDTLRAASAFIEAA